MEETVRVNQGMRPAVGGPTPPSGPQGAPYPPQHPQQQLYRDYEHPAYGYEPSHPKSHGGGGGGGGGGSYEGHPHYDQRAPVYGEQPWTPYEQQQQPAPQLPPPPQSTTSYHQPPTAPIGYDPRSPYEDDAPPTRDYSPPRGNRYEDAPYDGRPRHMKPPGPTHYDETPPPPPPPAAYEARSPYEPEAHHHPYPPARSPEPPKHYYGDAPRPAYTPSQTRPYGSDAPPPPPPKPDTLMSPPTCEGPLGSKPLPLPPLAHSPRGGNEEVAEDEADPAMRPQSVLTRVKMFENKRSVSVDRGKEGPDSCAIRPTDLPKPMSTPGPVFKTNSLTNLEQEKTSYRAPEPQRAQSQVRPAEEPVRPNNYDAEEDEEYYRKQLSYFDRRNFDNKNNQPLNNRYHDNITKPTQLGYPYTRAESVEKTSPVEKRYDPVISPAPSQYVPPAPPTSLPKLTPSEVHSLPEPPSSPKSKTDLSGLRAPSRDETAPGSYLPPKPPVNGMEAPPKAPAPSSIIGYSRYVPKPYTSAARPFERKFESPKFNHNLLPNDSGSKGPSPTPNPVPKPPQLSPQPPEHDSGVDTFTRTMEHRPKYTHSNNISISALAKAVPVSPSALEEDEEDDGHTVVATARGIFNCNGGVLSSIETGVSIIIPQGAIPDSVEQEIYFKVCRDNSILPPLDKEKGETLLSPLVMCGPHGLKFQKPVELRLPHCASMTPDGWSFALKSSESSSGEPKNWQNKSLPGDPNYLVGANCVSVLIDHF